MVGWVDWLRGQIARSRLALRWQIAKSRLAYRFTDASSNRLRSVTRQHLCIDPQDCPANCEPYVRFARFWEDYAGWFSRDWANFLTAAEERFGGPTHSVLDLACGTGKIARVLAASGRKVVGLDMSTAMLLEAEVRSVDLGVRYVAGDFRDFALGEEFDAIVCGGDSLNYLAAAAELGQVFACVFRHLRPGGLFAFDVLDERYMRRLTGVRVRTGIANETVDIVFRYDPERRVSEDRAILGDAIERHRRIPIERTDVERAATACGLAIVDRFSDRDVQESPLPGGRQFYVLRRPAG